MNTIKKITAWIIDIKWNNSSFYLTIFRTLRFGLNCGKDSNVFTMITFGLLWFDIFLTLQFKQSLID